MPISFIFTGKTSAMQPNRVLSGLAAAALAVGFSTGAWAADGGTLRAALTGEPDVLDPATSTIYTGAQVYEGIFSKLIDMDAQGTFIPDLAIKWTQTDPTTWTFDLVPNATFQNGEKFSSADVKYTFDRILDPKNRQCLRGPVRADRFGRADRSHPPSCSI